MYEDYFGFNRPPFSITPDPRFFYDNPVYREAFASLRYGIEARKGFIVITGEAGTGKTTLLKVFMQGAEATIHTAFIFNPKLTATELLRLILNDLGIAHSTIAHSTEDRVALMRQLNDYLIEQLKKRQIVALLVDEAQQLSNELLEELRLLSNLETNKDKLIQIVLMGQPELEERLDQPELRQLKQRVAVRCRLSPLKNHEVYFYIESRLRTAGFEGKELFDPEAVERITLYSKGIPRIINLICDNALLICYAASKRKVSEEMVEEVAGDLQLAAPPPVERATPPAEFEKSKDLPKVRDETGDEARLIKEAEPSNWVSRRQPAEFQDFFIEREQLHSQAHQKRSLAGLGIGFVLGLVVAAGLGAVFYPQSNRNYVSDIAGRIENRIERRENLKPVALEPGTLKEDTSNEPRDAQALAPEKPPISTLQPESKDVEPDATPVPETSKPAQSQAAITPERSQGKQTVKNDKKYQDKVKIAARRPSDIQVGSDRAPTNDRLEFEVYKAIANRAITGVEVSVIDGTAYLGGRVATERQKLAAAQAARSVSGVKNVRDQIIVNYSFAPRYSDARSKVAN